MEAGPFNIVQSFGDRWRCQYWYGAVCLKNDILQGFGEPRLSGDNHGRVPVTPTLRASYDRDAIGKHQRHM